MKLFQCCKLWIPSCPVHIDWMRRSLTENSSETESTRSWICVEAALSKYQPLRMLPFTNDNHQSSTGSHGDSQDCCGFPAIFTGGADWFWRQCYGTRFVGGYAVKTNNRRHGRTVNLPIRIAEEDSKHFSHFAPFQLEWRHIQKLHRAGTCLAVCHENLYECLRVWELLPHDQKKYVEAKRGSIYNSYAVNSFDWTILRS